MAYLTLTLEDYLETSEENESLTDSLEEKSYDEREADNMAEQEEQAKNFIFDLLNKQEI